MCHAAQVAAWRKQQCSVLPSATGKGRLTLAFYNSGLKAAAGTQTTHAQQSLGGTPLAMCSKGVMQMLL